jgi:hypothetical protein
MGAPPALIATTSWLKDAPANTEYEAVQQQSNLADKQTTTAAQPHELS